MMVPVIQSDDGSRFLMQFFLPKNFSMQNALLPKLDIIKVVTARGGFYAIRKYSGRSTIQNYKKRVALLRNRLNKDETSIDKAPIMGIYSGPFTPSSCVL